MWWPFTCIERTLAALLLLALLPWQPAAAARFETLLMPGKLIAGHAEYEQQCERCHEKFSKEAQDRLCLDCHDRVAADVRQGRGYHGRAPDVEGTACQYCHTDHQGRAADVVPLDRATFDHGLTDFALNGAHRGADCGGCHGPDETFAEAPSRCIACHEGDDRHRGRLGEQCSDCHGEQRWSEVEFDHGATDFPLRGEHEEVLCAACHPGERYRDTPSRCVACHRLDDVHGGAYGAECDSCHDSDGWKRVRFDHDRNTDFRLLGSHRDLGCGACHRNERGDDKPPTTCFGCHRNDDEHRGRNGRQCADCHGNDVWDRVKFDHEGDTGVALVGAHADVACRLCHAGGVEQRDDPRRCNDCHGADDVHGGELGDRCDRCHGERDWAGVVFEHDLTAFPLHGLHAVAPCETCHLSRAFSGAPGACAECHRADDVHEGGLGQECAGCHNPNGWRLWRYDHDRTDFPLQGAHAEVVCRACHDRPLAEADPSSACVDCHRGDDVHGGRFGRQCERCHDSASFRNTRFNR